jgi:hypothetical protein
MCGSNGVVDVRVKKLPAAMMVRVCEGGEGVEVGEGDGDGDGEGRGEGLIGASYSNAIPNTSFANPNPKGRNRCFE